MPSLIWLYFRSIKGTTRASESNFATRSKLLVFALRCIVTDVITGVTGYYHVNENMALFMQLRQTYFMLLYLKISLLPSKNPLRMVSDWHYLILIDLDDIFNSYLAKTPFIPNKFIRRTTSISKHHSIIIIDI